MSAQGQRRHPVQTRISLMRDLREPGGISRIPRSLCCPAKDMKLKRRLGRRRISLLLSHECSVMALSPVRWSAKPLKIERQLLDLPTAADQPPCEVFLHAGMERAALRSAALR